MCGYIFPSLKIARVNKGDYSRFSNVFLQVTKKSLSSFKPIFIGRLFSLVFLNYFILTFITHYLALAYVITLHLFVQY